MEVNIVSEQSGIVNFLLFRQKSIILQIPKTVTKHYNTVSLLFAAHPGFD